ncbi:hypothetical protein MGSAQ_001548, partial [marine sediment metagenome]
YVPKKDITIRFRLDYIDSAI